MGNWIYNEKDIRSHTVGYFSSLFKSDAHFYQAYLVPNFFPSLNANYLDRVTNPVVEEEIKKKTIFSMKPLKTPGIDGLQAIFYQNWFTPDQKRKKFNSHVYAGYKKFDLSIALSSD